MLGFIPITLPLPMHGVSERASVAILIIYAVAGLWTLAEGIVLMTTKKLIFTHLNEALLRGEKRRADKRWQAEVDEQMRRADEGLPQKWGSDEWDNRFDI